MNTLVNHVQLIGHLGQDVELKEIAGGRKMTKFSLATNESYHNKEGEKVEKTTWHNLSAFGKSAELFHSLCKKGSKVLVRGKLDNGQYETPQGEKRYVVNILMEEFLLLK